MLIHKVANASPLPCMANIALIEIFQKTKGSEGKIFLCKRRYEEGHGDPVSFHTLRKLLSKQKAIIDFLLTTGK
ncbi:MAG: hypothetical protein AYP45_03120 [Candidatus Brocadia carolinensis]|uniref:Uncharacterized protein n=1 Tax=Candidatus Brocadia carolinensis TaxID=1004156 RepID=A0A1V4AWE6_9BACT|nr:MAG: hypothetical protein AYP45_03120 [Candidatus Brocadia caroliniensis]